MVKFKNLMPEQIRTALARLAEKARRRKLRRRWREAADRVRLAELMRTTVASV